MRAWVSEFSAARPYSSRAAERACQRAGATSRLRAGGDCSVPATACRAGDGHDEQADQDEAAPNASPTGIEKHVMSLSMAAQPWCARASLSIVRSRRFFRLAGDLPHLGWINLPHLGRCLFAIGARSGRDVDHHARTFAWRALDGKPGANGCRALAHGYQPHMARVGRRWIEPDAVIGHLQRDATVSLGQRDANDLRPRVACDVVAAFLDDPIEGFFFVEIQIRLLAQHKMDLEPMTGHKDATRRSTAATRPSWSSVCGHSSKISARMSVIAVPARLWT